MQFSFLLPLFFGILLFHPLVHSMQGNNVDGKISLSVPEPYYDKLSVQIVYWHAYDEESFKLIPETKIVSMPLVKYSQFKEIIAKYVGNTQKNITVSYVPEKSDAIGLIRKLKDINFYNTFANKNKMRVPNIYVYDKNYVDFTRDPKSIWFGKKSSKIQSKL